MPRRRWRRSARLRDLFDAAEIIEAYGQTESTDGVLMARGTSVFDREGTVGRQNPFVTVAIRRPDGSLAGTDEEGEIVVGGPTVMRGYHRDAKATATAVRDGWLHTGDLGRCAGDGYVFVTGRVKDVIITGGENVSPAEVEEVLRAHPDVADVAVDRHAASALGRAGDGRRGAAQRDHGRRRSPRRLRRPAARRLQASRAASTSWRRCRGTPTTRCRRTC